MCSLAMCRCLFWLMRYCILGRWTYLPVSERFRLVWKCLLFDYSTYTQFCVHWHGGQSPRRLVPNYAVVFRLGLVKVRSLDGDTEYFDIVAGVLKGETLALYHFIICLDYVLRTSIDKIRENGFELTKKRSRMYPAKTITDADYADTGKYTQPSRNALDKIDLSKRKLGTNICWLNSGTAVRK